jgi:Carboxypeptidase regulatory-like domain/TonB dependent receptor-like, beta-barrel
MRKIFNWLLVLSLLLVPATSSVAQTFGQITGAVTDGSGGILVGATVVVTNTQTNATREAQTNSAGSYVFPNLLPGVYNVRVELQGFQTKVVNGVELQVQQTARLDFSMELGSVEVAVEVTGTAPMINITDATVGTVVDNKQILELPLNGRNFINLVSLSQNVSSDYAGGSGGGASGRQGGDRTTQNFSIAGQRREYNHYTLDGIVNQDVNFNTYAFLPSIDSVEEFKVQTGVYSAEFGREAAQVNVSTKSGTNAYHGTIFEFIRNDAFDAAPYAFTSVRPKANPFKWNQFGFTLGGPVQIPGWFNGTNKLFFMSNYEGFRLRQQQQVLYNTPPVAMRNGDFSGAPVAIRDPNTGQPFPGNIIPTGRLDKIARGLLEFYPEPNVPGAGLSSNHLALQNHRTDKDQFTQRIDFAESAKSFWFGRFSWTDEFVLAPALKDNGQKVETNVKQVMVSNTRTLSPSLVNEFRFGATKFYNNLAQELQYERNIHEEFGIGLFIPPPIGWGLPSFSIAGFSGFGAGAAIPFTGDNKIFQFIDNVSWIRGNHSMKMGAEVRRDHYNMIGTQEIRGSLIIDNPQTGYGFADYMLGMLSRTASAGALGEAIYRQTSQSYFFQDTWRVRPSLTLDLGLRYEYTPPWLDLKGEQMNMWIPPGFGTPSQQGKPCFVRIGSGDPYEGVSTRFDPRICVTRDGRMGDRLVQPDKTDFAPRLGAAWSLNPKMTVRAGYGIFYVQDTTNPVFDMSRNIQGRITSGGAGLTFAQPYTGGSTNPCGVQMPPQVCVQAPQVYANQYDRRTPYIEQYLFNVQREMTGSTVLEVGYFGSRGHKLQRYLTLNQPVPGLSAPILDRAPAPELGNWQVLSSVGYSNYNSLAAKVTRRLSNGLTGLVSYTLSKSFDNGSGIRTVGNDPLKPQKGDCAECERGLSVFDVRHRLVASFLYEMPFGTGRKYLSQGGVLNVLAGGWQLGGMMRLSSGFPLTVTSGQDRSNTLHGYDRPNPVAGVSPELDDPSPSAYFNVSAYQMNAFGTFGNLGRSTLTGPGVFVIDFSALKNFTFGSNYLQLRIEAFNLLNRPNFADPNTNLAQSNWNAAGNNSIPTAGSGAFGTITSIRGTVPMRQVQFALKYVF